MAYASIHKSDVNATNKIIGGKLMHAKAGKSAGET
jgi:hypothetical protein